MRNLYNGHWSLPLTDIFANRSYLAFFSLRQNALIFLLLPGSCLPKLLAGHARIFKPLALYFSCIDSKLEYVRSVYPHLLATLTISITSPLYFARDTFLPSMFLSVKS